MARTHFRTCNLCEAMCGLELEIEGDQVVAIRGDEKDEFSRGYHCIKGEALADLHASKDRLKRPLQRTKGGWRELAWDEALDLAAEGLRKVQAEHGDDAVATYVGNPNVHNYGSLLGLQGLLRAVRSRNKYAATSVDQLPHHMVGYLLFGHQLMLPVPDIDRTQYLLILGGNPLVSRGSMMTAPDVTTRLKAIGERGGKVVLVDPRRTETAAVADEHLFIRPGTDVAFLASLLQVVFAEGLARLDRLAEFTDGVDELKAAVSAYPPERTAAVTGVAADVTRRIAREFAGASAAVCYGRVGVSTQAFGAASQWLVTALNIVTGNLDRAGGSMFTTPAIDPLPYVSRGHYARWRSRVRGLPEFAGEQPVSTLADEMETPGDGQVRAFVTVAGNPVLSTPNGARLERALGKLDFMVSVDIFLNETTRFANLILPPTGALEHENYDLSFHVLAVRNTAKFSTVCFEPESGARHDWEILGGLERRLAASRPGDTRMKALKRRLGALMTPERVLDLGLRFGPYGSRLNLFGDGLSLAKLKRHPHGIDLGPLEPRLPRRLFTKSKRIALAPAVFVGDLARVEEALFGAAGSQAKAAAAGFDLLLIGRRQVRVNNSWMGHMPRLTKGKPACTALLHTEDAAKRGIATGDWIRVTSAAGSLEIPATVVEGIMPGVISIPHGYGHSREGVRLSVAPGAVGVSVNDVTDEQQVDALSGNAVLNGVPVRVEAVRRA